MHHLYIFLSSPGYVSRERQLACGVIDRIQSERAYRDRLKLEVVAWDKPGAGTAMPAQMEPQEAIDKGLRKPSECDIVIVIFWARMGTPLSENYKKKDGSRYRSGTEYEFLDALDAAKKEGKPDVWVYRKKGAPDINAGDPKRKEKLKQWDLVEEFFAEFRNPDGSFRSFYKVYDEPSDFEKLLEVDLRDIITKYLNFQPIDEAEIVAIENSIKKAHAALNRNDFEETIKICHEIFKIVPENPEANLIAAVAITKGKNIQSLKKENIKLIEMNLQLAKENPNIAYTCWAIWGVVKYDYFKLTSRIVGKPSLKQIKQMLQAGNSRSLNKTLFKKVNASPRAKRFFGLDFID